MKPHIIVSSYMLDREDFDPSYYNSWDTVCKELEIDYSKITVSPTDLSDKEFYNNLPNSCKLRLGVIPVFFGSIQFCRKIKKVMGDRPYVMFFDEHVLDCSNYYNRLKYNIPLLNEDYIILEYKTLIDNWSRIFNLFNEKILFIRPNSNMKQFTGGNYLSSDSGKDLFIKTTNENNGWGIPIRNKELCLVSTSKKIKSEYRFLVLNKEIISGSQYNRELSMDVRIDYLEKARKIVELVVDNDYQPDIAYTCDVAELDTGECKIIELNNGSSSGFYAMDKRDIVKSIIKYCQNI